MKRNGFLIGNILIVSVLLLYICLPIQAVASVSCLRLFSVAVEDVRTQLPYFVQLSERLGWSPQIKVSTKVNTVYPHVANENNKVIAIEDKLGNEIGMMNVIYDENQKPDGFFYLSNHRYGPQLYIAKIEIAASYRRTGISAALLEQALNLWPHVKIIEVGALVETNQEMIEEALAKGSGTIGAIQETPAFKLRLKFGFTKILPETINDRYGFQVVRP